MEGETEDETLRQRESTRISKTMLMERIDALEDEVANLSVELQDSRRELETVMQDNFQNQERMGREIQLLRDLITSGALGGGAGYTPSQPKLKVREPDTYDGVRDDKVLGNFFFDMEEYLDSIPGLSDEAQVRTAARYLVDNAKLWWRTRAEDRAAGRDVTEVNNWVQLKDALKDQFLPGNSAWVARNKLLNLKQTGKVSDYVKTFSSLMLEIKDMAEEDRLFHFMKGLQFWAQEELRRGRVRTLTEATKEAERLMDFRAERTYKPQASPPKSRGDDKGKQSFQPNNRSKTKGKSSHHWSRRDDNSDSSSGGSGRGSNQVFRSSGRSYYSGRRSEQKNTSPRAQANKSYNYRGGHLSSQHPRQESHANAMRGGGSDSEQQVAGLPLLNCRLEDLTPDQIAGMEELVEQFKAVSRQAKGKALMEGPSRISALVTRGPRSNEGSNGSRSPKRSTTPPRRRKVEAVVATSKYRDTDGRDRRLFLVKWKHEEKRTWEPAELMVDAEDKVTEFFKRCEASRQRRELM